jgi:hypothetical protein
MLPEMVLDDERVPRATGRTNGAIYGRELGRRRRARRGRDVQLPPPSLRMRGSNVSADASLAAQRRMPAPGFERLRPPSPLPRPYLEHLGYMTKHPFNRPNLERKSSSWTTVFSGERKQLSREVELKAIQRQSGWDVDDSPAVRLPPPAAAEGAGPTDAAATALAPVLTGSARHWGRGRCPPACAKHGGVCLPALGRCDCPRHRWGAACELHVQPALARTWLHHGWCVYNDSSPFFCDKPLCERSRAETHSTGAIGTRGGGQQEACVGDPLDGCRDRCNGKGTCKSGRCECIPGYSGRACERPTTMHCVSDCLGRGKCEFGFCTCREPYYGVDCSLQPPPPPPPGVAPPAPVEGHLGVATIRADGVLGDRRRRRQRCQRPCVYVYELPARMNVLALKAEPHYPFYDHGPADYRAFKAIHISLLRSPHRTTHPERADFFYVPTWDLHGSWGNPEIYLRAHRYISTVWPFWNRSKGADHIWTNTRDAGGCSNPWGGIWDQTHTSTLLTNWGGVTGLGGVPAERCFDATRDVVIPVSRIVKSPFLPFHRRHADSPVAAAAAAARDPSVWRTRKTLLFFHGAICWQTYDKVRSLDQLARKCRQKHGFLDHYSFGTRWEVYRRFRTEPGFNLRATDLLPPPKHVSLDDEVLRTIFCLCPSGTGWGMRVFHSAALGCIPVIMQRDEAYDYPPVLQAFEGLLLDWDNFIVRVEPKQMPHLPAILRALAANESALAAKREALALAWTRLVWREALPPEVARSLRAAPDAFDSLMQTLWLRLKFGLQGQGVQQLQD